MKFEKIISQESYTCDRFVAKACAMLGFFSLVAWSLNLVGLFVVEAHAMAFCCVLSACLLIVPLAAYVLREKGHCPKLRYKYFALVFVLLAVGVLYSFLTFHVIFLFLFPAIVFNIYGDKKLMKWTMLGTLGSMVFSHIASVSHSACPEEPFTTMHTVMVYGLLPKILIYFSFMYVFFFESDHNKRMLQKVYSYARAMHQTQEELVRAFAEMCESKSGQTGSHVKRVSRYVDIMAKQLNIHGEERECLVTASMMHDVGKLNIPAEILDKPGKLTEEEYAIVKQHTQYGHALLQNSPGRTMEIASDIALNHHERWDGKGYNGVAGEDISLYSRIMAIADVFDALVSKRSYKEKWAPQDAYDEILRQAGKQFDPALTVVFVSCYPAFLEVLQMYPDD